MFDHDLKRMQKGKNEYLINLIVSVIIFLVTFPYFEPVYGTGLDPSYVWAFNYLINHDFSILTGLTYPIGPLGFLKYTAAFENNLLISLIFFSFIKFSFIFLLLKVSRLRPGKVTPFSFLIILLAASFVGIDFAIIGSAVLLLILYHNNRTNLIYFILANLFAMTGILIKSSIGLSSFASVFCFIVIAFFSNNFTLKKASILAAISFLIFLVSGLLVFGGFEPYFSFLHGLFRLTGGYSEGLSLYPENNWWLLSGFIFTIVVVPLLFKDQGLKVAYFLLLLPLFAMWKHAMGREDIYHAQLLVGFLVIFWSILLLIRKKQQIILMLFAVLSIGFFYFNLYNVNGFKGIKPQISGLSNFNETVLHYNEFNKKHISISKKNILVNKIDRFTRDYIGEATVDVYPWDLSVIPANNFNWKPRKTLELGASTSSWLSRLGAGNYVGSDAANFLIFHFKNDKWGGKFGSLDGRYILNDEPVVLYNLLNNYQIHSRTNKYLLLEKTDEPSFLETNALKNENVEWNEWLTVPKSQANIVRVAFRNEKTLPGRIKSFLYKGEAYYIDYKFRDGKVLTYRFLRSNAEDGLWIYPFILRPDKKYKEQQLKEIRFRCSDFRMVKAEIKLSWQTISFSDGSSAWSWFGKTEPVNSEVLFKTIQDFESNVGPDKLSSDSYRGKYAESVKGSKFSTSLDIDLDTLWNNDLSEMILQVELFYKNIHKSDGKAMLILAIDKSGENVWLSFPLENNDLPDEWKYASLSKTIYRGAHKQGTVKAYVWNNGYEVVNIDDFKLRVTK